MQKVLVSAGAVGAAALELNNNQATEVVEAAPHGVQQRRRSQSKKEEPAALIKRGHTTAKAHHGNSAARVQNAGQVFWIVFGIIGILGLALGLGLGLGLPSAVTCPSVSSNSFNTKATKKACLCAAPAPGTNNVECELKTKADYDAFEAAECTQIDGPLTLDKLIVLAGANAVPKLEFKTLIEVVGDIEIHRQSAVQTTQEIVFKKLAKVSGMLEIGGSNYGPDMTAFTKFEANCLQESGAVSVFKVGNLETFELDKLEKVTDATLDGFQMTDVGTSLSSSSYSFGRLQEVASYLDIRNIGGNQNKWSFKKKGLKIKELVVYVSDAAGPANTCGVDLIEIEFNKATDVFITNGFLGERTGKGAAFLKFQGQDKVSAYCSIVDGFKSLNPSVKVSDVGGATDAGCNVNNECTPAR